MTPSACRQWPADRGPAHAGDRGDQPPRYTTSRDTTRCGNLDAVRADPQAQCLLAEKEGRLYWKLLSGSGSTMALAGLPSDVPCPFGGGLYQLMRSRVLGDALVAETGADWADVAVCVHPSNDQVGRLETPVAGYRNVTDAFLALAPTAPLLAIDPFAVVSAIRNAAPKWTDWADYMKDRYALD